MVCSPSGVSWLAARAVRYGKAKLALSAEAEIRTSRWLSGRPRVKVELRELFKAAGGITRNRRT
ncbi:hypothetical protein EMEDMD4_970012 [Sinorhizobium medicae]|uniref:Uncharacterized protein n=1 Tax=Sinorhizobium medicae TaxID=110321 RepID=A0A508X8F4_9HYPH|nr:hypothetical protein EMEDMD4_970012 [Sinorhizobium medicae]